MNGYDLSRKWFDWCFENPEKVSPNHSAIYFFAIEHCNRLGWKEKFGFPTQMAMDALGIKKHQTYIKYFNELCEWGFFVLVQKSMNQYSANIISLSKAMPKNGKALDKAFIKHAAKQTDSNGQSNSSIDKQVTSKQETTNNTWRENFNIYKDEMLKAQKELISDKTWINKQETYYPNIDIKLSLQKSVELFWGSEAGWKHKKKSKSKSIDYKSTLTNSLSQTMNKVYKPRESFSITNELIKKSEEL